jgi:putative glutamine amidotransferase
MSRAVAITAARRTDDRERVAVNASYVHAVARAGLVPLVIPSVLEPARAVEALDVVRGLVLTGGEDVDPARYGTAPHPKLERTDPARDAVEIALVEAARARRLPILAICRGLQLLNVAFGGTLYQDLASERPGPIPHQDQAARHAVRIAPGSLLHRTLGATSHSVNSRHHQAVKTLGPGLVATAWAEDDLIEAVELTDPTAPWLLGVQWHPEDTGEARLFGGFAGALG